MAEHAEDDRPTLREFLESIDWEGHGQIEVALELQDEFVIYAAEHRLTIDRLEDAVLEGEAVAVFTWVAEE